MTRASRKHFTLQGKMRFSAAEATNASKRWSWHTNSVTKTGKKNKDLSLNPNPCMKPSTQDFNP
jgi:hypothetical protein